MNKSIAIQSPSFLYRLLLRWGLLFVVLFPLSFPFERGGLLPDPGFYTQVFFEKLARFTGDQLLHIQKPYASMLVSDTIGFYLNALNLLLLSLMGALAWTRFSRSKPNDHVLASILVVLVRYYLALQLLWYGCDKIFKVQFYLPEPNTLFTTVGQTPRDLLYWSTMGSSYTYTFFAGFIEVLAAALLFFHRTYLLGALVAAGVMTNVLMINLGFDVSVKLYSFFLLFLSGILLAMQAGNLYRFFVLHVPAAQGLWRPVMNARQKTVYRVLKTLVVLLFLADALSPFVRAGNYNDDRFPRPFLHGAYAVKEYRLNHAVLEPSLENTTRWKRFFVHRRGYFIVQRMNDEMADFALTYDLPNSQLLLTTYDSVTYSLHFEQEKAQLVLSGIVGKDTLYVEGETIDLQKLPLLKHEFSWTINE